MRRATPRTHAAAIAAAACTVAVPARGRAQPACPLPPATATSWAPPLDRPVALGPAARTLPLRMALDRLAAAAGVRLSYSRELLPLDRPSCLDGAPRPLGAALAHLLHETGVAAVALSGDQVVLAPASATAGTPSVPVLQQVVVTGSASAAPARRLPFALDVADGSALAPASATTPLATLLNGRIPGLWAWNQPPTTLLARYGSLRGASSFGVSAPKLYLDGVELANPLVLTDLAPERIARIEVIRGPQGAALYGADAINGVVNVVSRHDGAKAAGAAPSVTVRSGFGAAGGDYASRPALAQDHAVLVRTGAGARTAGLSLTASTLGAYVPDAGTRRLTATGDLRRVTRNGTVTATARLADAATSAPPNPLLHDVVVDPGVPGQRLQQLTAGVTTTRAAGGRWTHTVTAGIDAYRLTGVATDVSALAVALDSAQRAATGNAARATLRASSSATVDVAPRVRATITGIADLGVLRDATTDGDMLAGHEPIPRMPGYPARGAWRGYHAQLDPLAGGAPATTRRAAWLGTTGLVGQVTLAVDDALFVTAGLRGERNDGFAEASRFAALPTVGVAAVRALGAGAGAGAGGATLKLRAAYGSGLRPARSAARSATWRGIGRLGADLTPEAQRGIEAGLDLLAGGGATGAPTFTASATRFDQRASGLLQQVSGPPRGGWRRPTPDLTTAPPAATLRHSGPRRIGYTVENVGVIDNGGWELESALQTGPLAVGATLTLIDSRVRRTAGSYSGDLRPGDRMLQVPRRTVGAFATWRAGPWSAAAQVARAHDWINYDRLALARSPLDASQLVGAQLRQFWRPYAGVTHLGATLGRDVVRGVSVVLTGSNLLDNQYGEPDNATLLPGRTLTAGVRATF